MKQIRRNVFETNSSSTHSITMCSRSQFEDWKKGKVLFDEWKKQFVVQTITEADKTAAMEEYIDIYNDKLFYKKWDELSEDEKDSWYQKYYKDYKSDDDDLVAYNEYFESYDLETYTSSYTSESGDEIVAFGKYGYDG